MSINCDLYACGLYNVYQEVCVANVYYCGSKFVGENALSLSACSLCDVMSIFNILSWEIHLKDLKINTWSINVYKPVWIWKAHEWAIWSVCAGLNIIYHHVFVTWLWVSEDPSYRVPRRRVRSPMNTDLISFPKEAALTGSSFCSWQCSR